MKPKYRQLFCACGTLIHRTGSRGRYPIRCEACQKQERIDHQAYCVNYVKQKRKALLSLQIVTKPI